MEVVFYTLHKEDQLQLCPKDGYIGITPLPCPLISNYRIVGSCNGIFCLQNCLENRNHLTLWNPSIRRKVSLPEYPRIFEPLLEGFGLGFDPISDDYKIVWISYARDTSLVYAVKTGTWSEIASPKPRSTYVSYQAHSLSGVLHWPVSHLSESSEIIPTCDLRTHVFGMIPLPSPTRDWITTGLTTIKGSLALISFAMKFNQTWIRVRRDTSWYVVFKLNTDQLYIKGVLQLKLQLNNNDDLLLTSIEEDEQLLHVFNPKTGVLSRVIDFNTAARLINFRQYVETLHLLDMGESVCKFTEL